VSDRRTDSRGGSASARSNVPGPSTGPSQSAVMVNLADVERHPVRWVWPGRIARGKLTLIAGDPGLGKSFLTIDLAARMSTGATWPDDPLTERDPAATIILSAEDDPEDTIAPRFDACDDTPHPSR